MSMRISTTAGTILWLLFSGAGLCAQAGSDAQSAAANQQGNTTPHAKLLTAKPLTPAIPLGSVTAGRKHMLEFRTQEEMSEADRELLLNAEGTIEERARFNDFAWNEGPWSLQQAVCPALPKHILVQFTRNHGKGDVSVFTAVIPRDPEGRIRIIPVERRGYSLWSPAPVNQITINIFNRIRAEEKTPPRDWLTLGLCYASMAGARPKADLLAENQQSETWPMGEPATLVLEKDGKEEIEFVDMAALPKPMHWVMSFDKRGKLLKATHKPADVLKPMKQTQQIVEVPPASGPAK